MYVTHAGQQYCVRVESSSIDSHEDRNNSYMEHCLQKVAQDEVVMLCTVKNLLYGIFLWLTTSSIEAYIYVTLRQLSQLRLKDLLR